MFDKIIIGPIEKDKIVNKLLNLYKSRSIVFIDNNPQELERIRKRFKDIVLIRLKKRPEQIPLKETYLEARSLKEVEKLIRDFEKKTPV